ncbi:hypothetical protein CALVIDRAFT_552711 [Calocera viscosa TUFC12733]|uniref:Uncharacterized protein n=1 Tax=Calocera viscosa (strain TUFC12733) TaxID=1330018 RepID=A0A167R014_CALVF|nr:hypothetical protein CALVIDRAFT_552711 [Calocera viscosa TUFC12733]
MWSPSEWRKASMENMHHRKSTSPSFESSPRSGKESTSTVIYEGVDLLQADPEHADIQHHYQSLGYADAVQHKPGSAQYFSDAKQTVKNVRLELMQRGKQTTDAVQSMCRMLGKLEHILSDCEETNTWKEREPPETVLKAIQSLWEKHQEQAKLSGSAVDWMLNVSRILLEWYEENDPQGVGSTSQVVEDVERSFERLAATEQDLRHVWNKSENYGRR